MQRLTFANRAELKRLVETLRTSMPPVLDEQLVQAVSDYVSSRARGLGYEMPLTRDAVSLCYYLIAGEDQECRSLARASLQYLLRQQDLIPDDLSNVGLQDDFCVLQSAVREIAAQ